MLNRQMGFLIALVLFAFPFQATAQIDPYDSEMAYVNPFREIPTGCSACVQFYRVVRPLFPLVNHVVIGAHTELRCADQSSTQEHVYGASKGADDLAHFQNELKQQSSLVQPLGLACDQKAQLALEKAVQISHRWQIELQNQLSFVARMITTPLTGRICNNAAEEVRLAIQSELTKSN